MEINRADMEAMEINQEAADMENHQVLVDQHTIMAVATKRPSKTAVDTATVQAVVVHSVIAKMHLHHTLALAVTATEVDPDFSNFSFNYNENFPI
jgi:hypothetical protein